MGEPDLIILINERRRYKRSKSDTLQNASKRRIREQYGGRRTFMYMI